VAIMTSSCICQSAQSINLYVFVLPHCDQLAPGCSACFKNHLGQEASLPDQAAVLLRGHDLHLQD